LHDADLRDAAGALPVALQVHDDPQRRADEGVQGGAGHVAEQAERLEAGRDVGRPVGVHGRRATVARHGSVQ